MTTTTRQVESTVGSALYVAMELGAREWLLVMSDGTGAGQRRVRVAPGDGAAVERALRGARARFGMARISPQAATIERRSRSSGWRCRRIRCT